MPRSGIVYADWFEVVFIQLSHNDRFLALPALRSEHPRSIAVRSFCQERPGNPKKGLCLWLTL